MKKFYFLANFFIFFSLLYPIISIKRGEITFGYEKNYHFEESDTYILKSQFTKGGFLYIYPAFPDENNEGIFKIFFKKYIDGDTDANILNSDFYTIEVNSGLFIDSNKLDYDMANIFVYVYSSAGSVNFYLLFNLVNEISFPETTLINQFLLLKNQEININFYKTKLVDAITIISKNSLRNVDITVTSEQKDITFTYGGFFYPNGYSCYLDINKFDSTNYIVKIENKKKDSRDEVIILGYLFSTNDAQKFFPNRVVNGYQLYFDKIKDTIGYLYTKLTKNFYYTYQLYAKSVEFFYTYNDKNVKNKIAEYNSMAYIQTDTQQFAFFLGYANVNGLGVYIQFLDFNDLKVVQNNLQPLVTGLPKSILIKEKKSLYHFLPPSKDTKEIHYYIRAKIQNSKMYVAFKTCESFPSNCYITDVLTSDNSLPLIENIGMWFTQSKNDSSLQLIYVYCETECSYDILMSYDSDPLFMFPDNNYTKYIGQNQKDTFILPVFEYLSTYAELKIDLSVMSGKAKLTLYESRENLINNIPLNYNSEIVGNRQSFTINKSTFSSANYYKKELFVSVEGEIGSFYNIMYTTTETNIRILDNNRIFNDEIKVGSNEIIKTYTFENKRNDFYITITSSFCKSKITINDEIKSNNAYHYLYNSNEKKIFTVKISLINEGDICKEGFEDKIMIYAYNSDNTDILIGENDFISSSYKGNKINFKYYFNPNNTYDDCSYNLELGRLSKEQISYEYKLERISFDKTQSENNQKYSLSQTILSNKNILITSEQILSLCEDLNQNELCSLTVSFIPLSTTSQTYFNFYLNKNNKNYAQILTQETLINSINSNSAQYYYIELNKNYDTEVVINSFGNDLEVRYDVSMDKTKNVIPFNNFENLKNFHQIHISKSLYSSCASYCRLYVGVHMPKTEKETSSTFSINYFFGGDDNSQITDIILPINYYSRYKFDSLKEITYTLTSYDSSNIILELISESRNIEFSGTVSFSGGTRQIKSGIISHFNVAQNDKITIKIPNAGQNTLFKIKISSIGKQLTSSIYPMLSSFSEKCTIENINSACYYSLDLTPDINNKLIYFYVPESEDIYISIQELEFGFVEKPNSNINQYLSLNKAYSFTSKDLMKRPNWCEYNINKGKTLLIRLASLTGNKISTNLLTSFNTKPSSVTLNYGEKRLFNFNPNQNDNSDIIINIPKSNGNNIKYRINLHALKGNFVFKIYDQTYYLGLQADYKEDMSIIIDSDNINKNLELKVNKIIFDKVNIYNEFVFSVEYTVESNNKIIYELENEKINSFKFYKSTALSDIHLFMKANYTITDNKKIFKDVNMNIKIYTGNAEFDIKSYIVNEAIVEK